MIDGVTVIDTHTISRYDSAISLGVLLFVILLLGALLIWVLFYDRVSNTKRFENMLSLYVLLSFVLAFVIGAKSVGDPITEYQIVVSDGITFNEVTKIYEIMESKGNSYIVRLKDSEEVDYGE